MKHLNLIFSIVFLLVIALAVSPVYAATITVTTLADGVGVADCSLREALEAAQLDSAFQGCTAGSGDDTIVLSVSGNYTLTAGVALTVDSNVTIERGVGVAIATIQAWTSANQVNYRVFTLAAGIRLTLDNVTVRHGGSDNFGPIFGGCILVENNSVLVLQNATSVEGCHTPGEGGGIYANTSGHQISITDSAVRDNFAAGAGGGGIFSANGSLTLNNAIIESNQVYVTTIGSGGGIIYAGGALSITGGSISGNVVDGTNGGGGFGGGLSISMTSGAAVLNGVTVYYNQVRNASGFNLGGAFYGVGTGTISIIDSAITENFVVGGSISSGGAFYNGNFIITGSRIESNSNQSSTDGGAASTTGSITITDSCVVNNSDTALVGSGSATDVWWGDALGAYSTSNTGSSGDSVQGDGTTPINAGSPKSSTLFLAGATCLSCTNVSTSHDARVCS